MTDNHLIHYNEALKSPNINLRLWSDHKHEVDFPTNPTTGKEERRIHGLRKLKDTENHFASSYLVLMAHDPEQVHPHLAEEISADVRHHHHVLRELYQQPEIVKVLKQRGVLAEDAVLGRNMMDEVLTETVRSLKQKKVLAQDAVIGQNTVDELLLRPLQKSVLKTAQEIDPTIASLITNRQAAQDMQELREVENHYAANYTVLMAHDHKRVQPEAERALKKVVDGLERSLKELYQQPTIVEALKQKNLLAEDAVAGPNTVEALLLRPLQKATLQKAQEADPTLVTVIASNQGLRK